MRVCAGVKNKTEQQEKRRERRQAVITTKITHLCAVLAETILSVILFFRSFLFKHAINRVAGFLPLTNGTLLRFKHRTECRVLGRLRHRVIFILFVVVVFFVFFTRGGRTGRTGNLSRSC